MGALDAILFLVLLVLVAALVAAVVRDRTAEPLDEVDEVLRRAHERIDDYELERVRSMLRRR